MEYGDPITIFDTTNQRCLTNLIHNQLNHLGFLLRPIW